MNLFTVLAKPLGNRGLGRSRIIKSIYRTLSRYLIPPGVSTIRYDGLALDIDRRSYPEMLISNGSKYLPYEVLVFKAKLKEGMTVVDVGSAIGYYTLVASRIVGPRGKVYSIEPSPRNFELLKRNTKRCGSGNIILVNKAVADYTNISKFYLSDTNPLADSLGQGRRSRKSIEVGVDTLDNLLEGIKIDFIKMNIEGAEPLALSGMKEILKSFIDISMIVEFDPKALKGLNLSEEDYLDGLSKRFILQIISKKELIPFKNLEQLCKEASRRDGTILILCNRKDKV